MFPDEATAVAWFERIRWPDGRRCPHCRPDRTSAVASSKPMPYHCAHCRRYFSVKTGSVMRGSNLPLRKWALGIYLMSSSLKGVSSMKMHHDLGITRKTAWMMEHRIRQGWVEGENQLACSVGTDETRIGGRRRSMSNTERRTPDQSGAGRGGEEKAIVAGVKQRGGARRAAALIGSDRATKRDVVEARVAPGTVRYTDEAATCERLPDPDLLNGYRHDTFRHSASKYVRGMARTNGMGSFWPKLKREYQGTYCRMSVKHLRRYVRELSGLRYIRELDTGAQMAAVVLGMLGRRLLWQYLTA